MTVSLLFIFLATTSQASTTFIDPKGEDSNTWTSAAEKLENQGIEVTEPNVCSFLETAASDSVFTDTAATDNCIENLKIDNTLIIGMNEYLLQGNHQEEMSVEGMNDEIDSHNAIISAFECAKENSFKSRISECRQEFQYKISLLLRHYSKETEYLDIKSEQGEETDLENLYFENADGEILLSSGDENNQGRELIHYMDENLVAGSFVSETSDDLQRSLHIENTDNGEQTSITGSGEEIRFPESGSTGYWGDSESRDRKSVFEMNEGTEYALEVKDGSGEVLQDITFTLVPEGSEFEGGKSYVIRSDEFEYNPYYSYSADDGLDIAGTRYLDLGNPKGKNAPDELFVEAVGRSKTDRLKFGLGSKEISLDPEETDMVKLNIEGKAPEKGNYIVRAYFNEDDKAKVGKLCIGTVDKADCKDTSPLE